VPIQSSSDRILGPLGRHYVIVVIWRYLKGVARTIPSMDLGTDLMVGFPGESEKDFECSMELLEGSPPQYTYIFPYLSQKGMAARVMEGQ
jgi:tRNA A37 methylthiotransferase MiaB